MNRPMWEIMVGANVWGYLIFVIATTLVVRIAYRTGRIDRRPRRDQSFWGWTYKDDPQ
jgi:hypothetical protein